MRQKILDFVIENEVKLNVLFFIGGVIYDIFTLGEIDSFFSILQQIIYLLLIGSFLYFDFLDRFTSFKIPQKLNGVWSYKDFAVHFLLGALLSVYSIFFIKSSSFFSSAAFIAFMLILMVANELKVVQQRQIGLKIALYFICLFSFFSMMTPILFGYVGPFPFYTSLIITVMFIYGIYRLIKHKISEIKALRSGIVYPSGVVLSFFLVFYLMGWIPPVPLSVKEMGVYHKIEKTKEGSYLLHYKKSKWRFWQKGERHFGAFPNDKIYFFVRVFSPTRFNDKVVLHWQKKTKDRWLTTDRIPMSISGGRLKGYRGYTYKENYSAGDWRVLVETSDQREIGRLYFDVTLSDLGSQPEYEVEVH